MIKKIIILFFFVFSFNGLYAVESIKKGEVAKTDGYVFSIEEEKNLRKLDKERLTLKDLSIEQDKLIVIQNKRIKLYKDYVDDNTLLVWGKVGYFTLGVSTTAIALYLSSIIIKNIK
jgi:hypothetical protein